jgi:Amt family ammonium transporter
MHFTPSLRLRASEESEMLGIDDAEMGEFAYDYVGLEQVCFFILFIITKRDADHSPPQEIGHTLEMNGGSEAQAGGREGDHLHHHRSEEKVLQEGDSA